MKIEVSIPEAISLFKEVQKQPKKLFEIIRTDVKETVGQYLSSLMKAELTQFLDRNPYERKEEQANHRNGSYDRKFTLKGIGEVAVNVPRDRQGSFKSQVIPASQQYEKELRHDLSMIFLTGVSTRSLSMLSNKLIGRRISPGEISNANNELIDSVERWRNRDLSDEPIKYMFLDGVNFDMRIGKTVEKVPILAAIGVTEKNLKRVLGFQAGDKESATTWREFFKDLKRRGLEGSKVVLGIMDGLPGLEKVFKEEFSNARVQRCQVHVARNVLAKVPRKLKKAVADDMRSIFYASSKERALKFYEQFKMKWQRDLPSAVKCLGNSIHSCLTFFMCPDEEWISLRTTNIIERLNKEYKRRTKPMEIVAGENACYTLLAFVSLKMEIHWKTNPIGKVRKNLPFFKKLDASENFTQLN
ncbi:MAG: IS256 family transposase [Deltaproteobacteria bacterium]|nr:IS256 family transposase [Deltaproteobacteria bacterium]